MHANDSKMKRSAHFGFDQHCKPGIANLRILMCEKSADWQKKVQTEGQTFSSDKQERLMS
jgi:hypothetical protein